MKAILKFDLPDDRTAFNAAAKATDMAMVLWEIIYNIRKRAESHFENEEDAGGEPHAFDAIDFIYTEINKEMVEQGLNIDDLIE